MADRRSGQLVSNTEDDKDKDDLVETLSHKSIAEGLLCLGVILQIDDQKMLISLPGRVVGAVPLTSISEPYNGALRKIEAQNLDPDEIVYPVNDMFQLGQVVSVKVTNVERTRAVTRTRLSLEPQHLNGNFTSEQINTNMVLMAAIESKVDNGYIMDVGIIDVQAFLPFEMAEAFVRDLNRGRPLGIGQVLMCKIINVRRTFVTHIVLTATQEDVQSTVDSPDLTYAHLLPGMLVNSTVLNVDSSGIQLVDFVTFLEFEGQIHHDHAKETWYNISNHPVGSKVDGRILYIMPNGTRPYLTMKKNMFPGESLYVEQPSICVDSVHSVYHVGYEKRGIIVKFPSGEKGIIALQPCPGDMTPIVDDRFRDFLVGSVYRCFIIQYSAADDFFIGVLYHPSFQILKFNYKIIPMAELLTSEQSICEFYKSLLQ